LVQFGAIFGAPWYGTLAEQIERNQMGQLPIGAPNLARALQDIGRAITFQLKKLLLMAVLGLPLLLLSFVPVIGSAASLAELTLFALLVGLDFLDPPLERRRLSFRAKLCVLGRTFPASASFSFVCLGLVSIPLLNLLAVPLCIAAGTLYCCDRVLPNLPPTQAET
jgi:CysZ protein